VLKNSDLGASSPLSRGSHKIHRNKFNDLAGHENGETAAKSVKIDFSGVFQHYRSKADIAAVCAEEPNLGWFALLM
jgi:hypothetical protein